MGQQTHTMEPATYGPLHTSYLQRVHEPAQQLVAADGWQEAGLCGAVDLLLADQMQTWTALQSNVAAVTSTQHHLVETGGLSFLVQLNPARQHRTGTKKEHGFLPGECFLDAHVLPPEEKGVFFTDSYWSAFNPFSVLEAHVTHIHTQHTPQRFQGVPRSLLTLSRGLGSQFLSLYNGPEVGASADQHKHKQSGKIAPLPLETMLDELDDSPTYEDDDLVIRVPQGLGRTAIVLESQSVQSVTSAAEAVLSKLTIHAGQSEPGVNMLARRRAEAGFRLIIFPRSRFRPRSYDAGGPKIGPASLEMGGFIVVPEEKDLEQIMENPRLATQALTDVSSSHDEALHVVRNLQLARAA